MAGASNLSGPQSKYDISLGSSRKDVKYLPKPRSEFKDLALETWEVWEQRTPAIQVTREVFSRETGFIPAITL